MVTLFRVNEAVDNFHLVHRGGRHVDALYVGAHPATLLYYADISTEVPPTEVIVNTP